MSEYESPMRIAHRKHVYLDSNDPRAKTSYDLEKYRSRIGAKILIKDSKLQNIELEEYVPTLGQNTSYSIYLYENVGTQYSNLQNDSSFIYENIGVSEAVLENDSTFIYENLI